MKTNQIELAFDLTKAYIEMAKMCAFTINIIAGDIGDGATTVAKVFENNRLVTKEEANDILKRAADIHIESLVSNASHEMLMNELEDLLSTLSATSTGCGGDFVYADYFDKINFILKEINKQ